MNPLVVQAIEEYARLYHIFHAGRPYRTPLGNAQAAAAVAHQAHHLATHHSQDVADWSELARQWTAMAEGFALVEGTVAQQPPVNSAPPRPGEDARSV
jgi:hypothetical protein